MILFTIIDDNLVILINTLKVGAYGDIFIEEEYIPYIRTDYLDLPPNYTGVVPLNDNIDSFYQHFKDRKEFVKERKRVCLYSL